MKVMFMGTPDFALPTLRRLWEHGHEIVGVYTQPPRQAGRGWTLTNTPVAKVSLAQGFPVFCPTSLKPQDVQDQARRLGADVAVVVAYGLLLPRSFLEIPRLGCYNLHASLLPRWRGAAPIARAIMAQDEVTGVSIMQMTEGLDCGPVCAMERMPLLITHTAQEVHDHLAERGARCMEEVLRSLDKGTLTPHPQDSDGVTYAHKLTKEETKLSFHRSSRSVLAQIHGLSPFPGAWTTVKGVRIKILKASLKSLPSPDLLKEHTPGDLVNSEGDILCLDGLLSPQRVQREGRSPLSMEDFCRGFPLEKGDRCGDDL